MMRQKWEAFHLLIVKFSHDEASAGQRNSNFGHIFHILNASTDGDTINHGLISRDADQTRPSHHELSR